VHETSNIAGSPGTVEYPEDNGETKRASVAIFCRSENKPFGAGASAQVVLQGSIERIVTSTDMEAVKAPLRLTAGLSGPIYGKCQS